MIIISGSIQGFELGLDNNKLVFLSRVAPLFEGNPMMSLKEVPSHWVGAQDDVGLDAFRFFFEQLHSALDNKQFVVRLLKYKSERI